MPGRTISNLPVLFWVYVIESIKTGKRYTRQYNPNGLNTAGYIGFTTDLLRRLEEHGSGRSQATRPYAPFRLIYVEGCTNEADARRREHYFKVSEGRRYLAKRLREYNAARRLAS